MPSQIDTSSATLAPHAGKQTEFLASDETEVFFGGSRGPGKSWALAYDSALKFRKKDENGRVWVSIDYPEYSALLIRRKFTDIQKNFKPICDSIFKKVGGVWKEKRSEYVFPSGAVIILAHLDNQSDVDKYIGGNYNYLGIEEANQFPFHWLEMLYQSVRTTNSELTPFIRLTSNPLGIGHLWLKKRFFDVCTPVQVGEKYSKEFDITYPVMQTGETYVDEEGSTRKFIPALVFDNPKIVENDPMYVRRLKSIKDPVLKAAWLLGSWESQSGAFFEEWNPLYHIIRNDDFTLDKDNCRIYRAIDYGTAAPFVCLFVQIYPDGRAVVFDEIYQAGLVPSVQAKMILARSKAWGLDESDFDLTICDPAMKQKNHEYLNDMVGVFQLYLNEGMQNIHFGDNERIPGWQILREYLHIPDYVEGDETSGLPLLRFTERCVHCTESFPNLVRNVKNLEDVDTLCDDHAPDSARYLFKFIDKPYLMDKKEETGWRERIKKNRRSNQRSGELAWCY